MSCCDDNIRQHFDRMNEEANQDITRTFDLIDKMKSGEVTGVELDEKSMRIPFKIFPADRLSDDHTVEDRIHNAEVAMREKCAKIAETYYGWHKPDYPEYCDGDPAGDIAAKIRSLK